MRPPWRFAASTTEELGSDSASITKVLIEDCGDQFVGVKTLVEVAGGTETMALAIADAFPDVKCTVFDLPHMIEALEKSDKVAYVGGDMFELIPPADLLIIKWVHGWSDEECVKILKNCKEAIPTKEKGGKAIIIDKVMDTSDTTGKERNEAEWKTTLRRGWIQRVQDTACTGTAFDHRDISLKSARLRTANNHPRCFGLCNKELLCISFLACIWIGTGQYVSL
ncbi:trans-resveratrol di-O-methyltransferase-like isoform X2 [Iris pallida]|uniref:Trans-resveratrol di-O-methyltransferase-like isoform X2 n=1 Tax=Iris pallida TaxID=29817 RepID=A0AAX6HSQ3_IRIPA|nr:trans-resveratrol di-O-methyltransferase-like isoform X2 [Iris pallida]